MARMALHTDDPLRMLHRRIAELERDAADPALSQSERLQVGDSLRRHQQSYHQRLLPGFNNKESGAVRLDELLPSVMASIAVGVRTPVGIKK